MTTVWLPAQCGTCGHEFPAIPIGMDDPTSRGTIVMEESFTDCKRCGGVARIAAVEVGRDDAGNVRAVPQTEWDAGVMRRAGLLVQDLLAQGVPTERIIEQVREVDPDLASELEGKTRRQIKRWAKKAALFTAGSVAAGAIGWGVGRGLDEVVGPVDPPPAATQPLEQARLPDIGPGSRGTIVTRPDGTTTMRWYPAEPGPQVSRSD